jgi:hypothetical protein
VAKEGHGPGATAPGFFYADKTELTAQADFVSIRKRLFGSNRIYRIFPNSFMDSFS